MIAVAFRQRTGWSAIAGVLLLLDGIVSLVISAGAAWFSLVPPIAAIEGRPPIDQSQWLLALGSLAFAIASLWASQRALRGIRDGRMVGVALGGIAGVVVGSILVNAPVFDLGWLVAMLVFLAPQLLIVLGLLRWPRGTRA